MFLNDYKDFFKANAAAKFLCYLAEEVHVAANAADRPPIAHCMMRMRRGCKTGAQLDMAPKKQIKMRSKRVHRPGQPTMHGLGIARCQVIHP